MCLPGESSVALPGRNTGCSMLCVTVVAVLYGTAQVVRLELAPWVNTLTPSSACHVDPQPLPVSNTEPHVHGEDRVEL